MQKKNTNTLYAIILFCTIWVYYSLNARYINFSAFTLLRWAFPFALIGIAVLLNNGRIAVPPAFFWFFSVAVLVPSVLGIGTITSVVKYISWALIFYGSYVYFMQLRSKESIDQCLDLHCAVLVIFQLLNFVFAVLGINEVSGRSTGITTNANTLGIYSNLAFWAGVYWRRKTQNGIMKAVWIGFMASAVYTALASGSRTAFVVLVVDILVLVFLLQKNRKKFWLFAVAAAVFAWLVMSGKLGGLGLTATDRLTEEGGTTRDNLWEIAMNVWREHKIFGVGYTLSGLFNIEAENMQFHNSYLTLLVECGLWGAGIMAFGILPVIYKTVLCFRRSQLIKNYPEFGIGCFMLVCLAISAWSESFLFAVGSTEGFTFWFLLAWVLAYLPRIKEKTVADLSAKQ